MTPPHIVETFNTHRMLPEVVQALATARDKEVHEILTEIRRAATDRQAAPQHLIVYGERGSGKSFLLRLVELHVAELASTDHLQIACALLPEEQYNVKSLPQLLEAVAAKVRGDDWSVSAYAFDFRPGATAWEDAVQTLHAALDQRFGPGRGLAVAMIENFDTLAKNLFGADVLESSAKKGSAAAVERRAAEERLREFLGRQDARFMLIASATGTVDLDYDRPLFLVFKPVDLSIWDSQACIDYFNRRRQLAGAAELNAAETARARAIAEFIGGNPRLAQLLSEVLNSPDARTIAQTLDALSDHLADYYRRRLDDLPPNAAGLLDALIRTGEPCSQSELAARVHAEQKQIADAFSYLVQARLLSAVRERNGHGALYRVRDRLFVHFYRRRYGGAEQSAGLVPIAELLESFFSAQERTELARRHLQAGEFAEARLFRSLGRALEGNDNHYDPYRDRLVTGAASKLWDFAGLKPEEIEPARVQLREAPDQACKRWGEAAQALPTPLQRTVAKLLQAVAASRLNDDPWTQELLGEALVIAETDIATDARILTVDQMVIFSWWRLKDKKLSVEQCVKLQPWENDAVHDYVKLRALTDKAWSLGQLRRHEEALAACDHALPLAQQVGAVGEQVGVLRHKAWSLGQLGRHEEAIAACDHALPLAQQVGNVNEQAEVLGHKAWHLGQLGRHEEAVTACDHALPLVHQVSDVDGQAEILRHKAWSLNKLGRFAEALSTIQTALALPIQSVEQQERRRAQQVFFRIVAQTPDADVIVMLTQVVEETTIDDRWFDRWLNNVRAAVVRAEVWNELLAFVQQHAAWFAKAERYDIFDRVGSVWTDFVKARGRAETFALVVRDLPIIAEVMKLMPPGKHLRSVVGGLVAHCADAGFLRDVAGVLVEVFGPDAEDEARRLRAFAEVHAAEDKEKVLQRLDPDLAKAIRTIWKLPEPEDLLTKRGRRKGR